MLRSYPGARRAIGGVTIAILVTAISHAATLLPPDDPAKHGTEHSHSHDDYRKAGNSNSDIVPTTNTPSAQQPEPGASPTYTNKLAPNQHGSEPIKWTDGAIVVLTLGLLVAALLQWSALRSQVNQLKAAVDEEKRSAEKRAEETARALKIAEDHARAALEQAGASEKAAAAAEKSASLAIAAQRPWIDLGVVVTEPITIDEQGVQLPLHLALTNVGTSPAIDVKVCYGILPERQNEIRLAQAVEQANTIGKNLQRASHGWVIFPNKQEDANLMVTIGRDHIDAFGIKNISRFSLALRVDYRFPGGEGVRSVAITVWGFDFATGGYKNLELGEGRRSPTTIALQKMPIMDVAT